MKIRLKRVDGFGYPLSDYPTDQCAAAKCGKPSDVIDATYNRWSVEVPLCDYHYRKVVNND